MGNNCRVVYLVVALLAVSACVKPIKPTFPDIKSDYAKDFPNLGGLGKLGNFGLPAVCDQPESESKLSLDAHQNAILFSDRIAHQNREVIQKDGSSKTVMAPTRNFIRRFEVLPPALTQKVQAIEVENLRTCTKYTVVTVDQMLGVSAPANKVVPSQNDVSGKMELEIADIAVADLLQATFVRTGVNPIVIRYLGECLNPGKNGICLARPELANKMIEVDVDVETYEIPGSQTPVVAP